MRNSWKYIIALILGAVLVLSQGRGERQLSATSSDRLLLALISSEGTQILDLLQNYRQCALEETWALQLERLNFQLEPLNLKITSARAHPEAFVSSKSGEELLLNSYPEKGSEIWVNSDVLKNTDISSALAQIFSVTMAQSSQAVDVASIESLTRQLSSCLQPHFFKGQVWVKGEASEVLVFSFETGMRAFLQYRNGIFDLTNEIRRQLNCFSEKSEVTHFRILSQDLEEPIFFRLGLAQEPKQSFHFQYICTNERNSLELDGEYEVRFQVRKDSDGISLDLLQR